MRVGQRVGVLWSQRMQCITHCSKNMPNLEITYAQRFKRSFNRTHVCKSDNEELMEKYRKPDTTVYTLVQVEKLCRQL